MMRAFLVLFLLFGLHSLFAQSENKTNQTEEDLAFYADVLVNAVNPNHRVRANEIFYAEIKRALAKDESFENPFEGLEWISFQYAPDRSFRFISWQLAGPDNEYKYFGFYQDTNQLIELNSSVSYSRSLENNDISADNWYGQLIYEILPMDNYFLLFGFSQLDEFTKTKVVQVLDFKADKPNFNKAIFANKNSEPVSLISIAYSADVTASITYNPGLNMIVQDHLVNRMGRMPGQGPTFLPDGTYEGYKKDGDNWVYVEQLYNEIIEKPTEGTRQESLDVLGRKKKN